MVARTSAAHQFASANGRRLIAAALGALALSSSATASAEPETPPEEAVEAARRGREHFVAERYDEAAREILRAYDLYPHPPLLHNLARCYEQLDRPCDAAESYELYLDEGEPEGEVADEVRDAVRRLRRECDRRSAPGPDPRDRAPDDGPESYDRPRDFSDDGRDGGPARLFGGGEDEPSPRRRRLARTGWALFGAGAGLALTGAVVWLVGNSQVDCQMISAPKSCDALSRDEQWEVYRLGSAGDGLLYTGLAVGAAGLVIALVGYFYPFEESAVSLRSTGSGLALAVDWP